MSRPLIKVVTSHTGIILITGAICLKAAVLTGSWLPLISGYGLLIYAAKNKLRRK